MSNSTEDEKDEEHKRSMISAVIRKVVQHMHFRNALAMMMVITMCYKEILGLGVSDNFYMLIGLVIGMYFKQDAPK